MSYQPETKNPPPNLIFSCRDEHGQVNPFRLVVQMRDAGYSQADIHFVLDTLGWLEPMRQILQS